MEQISRLARSPLGSAAIGGIIVGAFCWIAIAAGWVASDDAAPAPAPALASNVSDDSGSSDRSNSVNEIYDAASAGVAFIEASGGGPAELPSPFGGQAPQQAATGSGFLIDDEGHVMTNAHVVDGAEQIEVTLGDDEQSYDAELVGQDNSTDIAVLRVDAPPTSSSRSRSATRPGSTSVTRSLRSATRSASTARSRPASCPRSSGRSPRPTASPSPT